MSVAPPGTAPKHHAIAWRGSSPDSLSFVTRTVRVGDGEELGLDMAHAPDDEPRPQGFSDMVRRLVGVFDSLGQAVEGAGGDLDARRLACCEASAAYRAIVGHVVAVQAQDQDDQDQDVRDSMATMASVLHLVEACMLQPSHLAANSHNTITLALVQWFCLNWFDPPEPVDEVCNLVLHDQPSFWQLTLRYAVQGRLREVREILFGALQLTQLHHVLEDLEELLSLMPVLSEQPDDPAVLKESFARWRDQCSAKLHALQGIGGRAPEEQGIIDGTTRLLHILLGHDSAIKQARSTWYEEFVAKLLYCRFPCTPAEDFGALVEECREMDSPLDGHDALIVDIVQRDTLAVAETLGQLFPSEPWVLAHMVDILHQSLPPSRSEAYSTLHALRDEHVVAHAEGLRLVAGHATVSEWMVAVVYLATCSHPSHQPRARALLDEIVSRQPALSNVRVAKLHRSFARAGLTHIERDLCRSVALTKHRQGQFLQFFYWANMCFTDQLCAVHRLVVEECKRLIEHLDDPEKLDENDARDAVLEVLLQGSLEWVDNIPQLGVVSGYARLLKSMRMPEPQTLQSNGPELAQLIVSLFEREKVWPSNLRPMLVQCATNLAIANRAAFSHLQAMDLLVHAEPLVGQWKWRKGDALPARPEQSLQALRSALHFALVQQPVE